MRVVAGQAGGRRLITPDGTTTRPSSDRVRETMFNVLFSLGALEDAVVVDLYAGSGSLGIEALSRGAESCVFVEADRDALDAIRENIETLGFGNQATIVAGDALNWLEQRAHHSGPFDLALADPPYRDEPWELILGHLGDDLLTESGLVVAESSQRLPELKEWDLSLIHI